MWPLKPISELRLCGTDIMNSGTMACHGSLHNHFNSVARSYSRFSPCRRQHLGAFITFARNFSPLALSSEQTVPVSSYLGQFCNPSPIMVTRHMELIENMNGPLGTVMLVDKPQGWTSFDVCGKLRNVLRIQKIGHAGTLDPLATGLLIVCLGKATKLADSYQAMTKVYSGTLCLGEFTASYDSSSPVIERCPWEQILESDIEKVKSSFMGEIMQVPPLFSAIKVGGERLYKKARRGEQMDLPPRKVTIHEFDIQRNPENRQELNFRVKCSKGTYIRSLCADVGRALNSCAHMRSLRRERIGDFSVEDAWDMTEFVEAFKGR